MTGGIIRANYSNPIPLYNQGDTTQTDQNPRRFELLACVFTFCIRILTSLLVEKAFPSSSATGAEPSSSALCSSTSSKKFNPLNSGGESKLVAELTRLAAMDSGDDIDGNVEYELPVYWRSRLFTAGGIPAWWKTR